jgi:predicted dehydrogenase
VIKAAIVGLGWWGRHIVGSLAGSDKLQITRGVEPRLDMLRLLPAGAQFPITSNLDNALRDDDIDAIVLATPHSTHEKQIIRSAQAGKHVFAEKPLTLTRDSAERAINACDAAGVVLGVGHERRFEPAMEAIVELVRSESLGTLMHVESNFSHDMLANLDPKDWRASPAESPIPALSAMGIHLTDAYIHLFGPIREVFAQTSRRHSRWGSGDTLSVQFLFDSGLTGYLSTLLVTSMFVRFQVFGSSGWVQARSDVHPGQEGITRLSLSRSGEVLQVRELKYRDTVLANLEAFADAAAGGTPYPFSREEKLGNVATMEAIVESARTGNPVGVE